MSAARLEGMKRNARDGTNALTQKTIMVAVKCDNLHKTKRGNKRSVDRKQKAFELKGGGIRGGGGGPNLVH